MRYELTIDAEYLDGERWNAAAGIREFLQNGRDSEIEQNARLEVRHYTNAEGKGVLVIENEGAVLARESLLLGRSTKRDRQGDLAGKWGEGLKLGALALLRAGYGVKIRNGGEVWTPAIEPSEKFGGRPVLVFNVVGGREERNRVQVEIIGVTAEDWAVLQEHFLFLFKKDVPAVSTAYGTILLGDKWRGRLYVKDIFVQSIADLEYGYNLGDAELDRDRRIIETYDLRARLHSIWCDAVNVSPQLFDEYYRLLEGRAPDLEGVHSWNVHRLSESVVEQVTARFQERHGRSAVPVETLAESKDIEHLGAKGVIAPAPLAAVLSRALGTTETVKARLRHEVVERFAWSDLDAVERANLDRAVRLVGAVRQLDLDTVDVVSFRSELDGQFAGDRVLVARRILSDRARTLATVVHEVAHRKGSDGAKEHVAEIESIWSDIVEGQEARS